MKRTNNKKMLKEHYDVSTVEGLAKYSRDLASAVLDGKLFDSNAVLAICATLHCNEDYAAECLDAWIETEQIRRSHLHTVSESKKTESRSNYATAKRAILKTSRELKESETGLRQVTTSEELAELLAEGEVVYAKGTGPFGEDQDAEVRAFGTIGDASINRRLWIDESELEELGYESEAEYLEDYAGTPVIVINDTIGQSDCNYYMLDARDVADCSLYTAAKAPAIDSVPATSKSAAPTENKKEVKNAEELKDLLASGETVYAASTGPFGEDKGAEVVAFGKIGVPGINKRLWVDDSEMEDLGYTSKEEYFEDFAGTEVIILNDTIGQSDCNFYMLDARDVADCRLYTK